MSCSNLFALVCVSLLIGLVYPAVYLQPPVDPPAKYEGQPGCYSPTLDIMLPQNELFVPEDDTKCEGYTCQSNGYTQITTCGVVGVDPNCEVTFDNSKPYPGCCQPIITCNPEVPETCDSDKTQETKKNQL